MGLSSGESVARAIEAIISHEYNYFCKTLCEMTWGLWSKQGMDNRT